MHQASHASEPLLRRTTPPSPILFTAATCSLIISTFLASFWPDGDLDGLPVKGLALGDYTLWPLWVWIYCLCWWVIQVRAAPAPAPAPVLGRSGGRGRAVFVAGRDSRRGAGRRGAQDQLKVGWFMVCAKYRLFMPFSVDRKHYEELNAKLPKHVDDGHH